MQDFWLISVFLHFKHILGEKRLSHYSTDCFSILINLRLCSYVRVSACVRDADIQSGILELRQSTKSAPETLGDQLFSSLTTWRKKINKNNNHLDQSSQFTGICRKGAVNRKTEASLHPGFKSAWCFETNKNGKHPWKPTHIYPRWSHFTADISINNSVLTLLHLFITV